MSKKKNKKKNQKRTDRVLSDKDSPLAGELFVDLDDKEGKEDVMMSGELDIGKSGNPVTIIIRDEKEGSEIEFNNVNQAWLMLEEKRKSSTGWLSLIIGDVGKIVDVLKFVAKATADELKQLVS